MIQVGDFIHSFSLLSLKQKCKEHPTFKILLPNSTHASHSFHFYFPHPQPSPYSCYASPVLKSFHCTPCFPSTELMILHCIDATVISIHCTIIPLHLCFSRNSYIFWQFLHQDVYDVLFTFAGNARKGTGWATAKIC